MFKDYLFKLLKIALFRDIFIGLITTFKYLFKRRVTLNYPNESDDLYKSFWPADLHLIVKDILRFHAIYWPAFLLAADIKPPKRVFGHGWILSGDEKMSKSKGNILDPLEIIDTYGLDP